MVLSLVIDAEQCEVDWSIERIITGLLFIIVFSEDNRGKNAVVKEKESCFLVVFFCRLVAYE